MANGLLDFLQGASNAAAANVSAPVDGLTWLLNKLGADIKTPVGGSDWMRERGLTAEPTNKLAGILGESVGGVLPMVTAAKAPQIAQGLLQAEKNLAAPRTLNPQTGAILWHGSPHKFDAFDASKIGTGEGNQAYGHGLYLADSADVAKGYADNLSMRSTGQTVAELNAELKKIKDTMQGPLRGQAMREVEAQLKMAKQASRSGASLYKVDLPDEHIAKMLDWDKGGREIYEDAARKIENYKTLAIERDSLLSKYPADTMSNSVRKMTGEDRQKFTSIANRINDGAKNKYASASDYFREQGIPGIRYLDGGSRGTGAGTSNYVVFPGNEGLLSILERNGQPIKKPFTYPQDKALATAQRNAAKPISEGGLGLPANNTPMERARAMGFDADSPLVHFSRHGVDVNELDSGKYAIAPFDAVGTHVGTPQAALERMHNTVGTTDQIKGSTYPVLVKKNKTFTDNGAAWDEDALSNKLRNIGGHNWSDVNGGKQTYQEMNDALRKKVFGEFDAIPYTNQVESKGSTSWVVPPKNIRSRFAAFDPARRNESDLLGRADADLLSIIAGGGMLGYGGYQYLNDK